jgi:hypothetical protein
MRLRRLGLHFGGSNGGAGYICTPERDEKGLEVAIYY